MGLQPWTRTWPFWVPRIGRICQDAQEDLHVNAVEAPAVGYHDLGHGTTVVDHVTCSTPDWSSAAVQLTAQSLKTPCKSFFSSPGT